MSSVSEFKTTGAGSKSAVGDVGSGGRFAGSWNSRRAKPTTDGARLDKTAEMDWRGSVVNHLHVIDLQFCGCIQHPTAGVPAGHNYYSGVDFAVFRLAQTIR